MSADRNVTVSSRSSKLSTIKINGVTTNVQTTFKKNETNANKIYNGSIFQAAESLIFPP